MTEAISTRCCSIALDAQGFIRATIFQGSEMTLKDAEEALAAIEKVSGGRQRCVLVDARGVKYETKEAREKLAGDDASRVTKACALLVDSPVSRVVGNFFLRQTTMRYPTRLFTTEESAVAWILDRSR